MILEKFKESKDTVLVLVNLNVTNKTWLKYFNLKTFIDNVVTSVPQKNVPSAVVIYYCAWYVFLRDRR